MRTRKSSTSSNMSVDGHVGRRLRERRLLLELSQSDVAKACKVTFQQVQKYERGSSRISASNLFLIAKALRVPVAYFFEGAENAKPLAPLQAVDHRQALKLVTLYHRISDPQQRQQFLELVRELGT